MPPHPTQRAQGYLGFDDGRPVAVICEATRDGVPPIELVDGQKLQDMFTQLELGLTPVTTYEVDEGFFAEFRV